MVEVDVVHAGRVVGEDPRLDVGRQLGIAEFILHPRRDGERAERVDEGLRRPVPDAVGAPEDPVGADRAQQLAEDVRGFPRLAQHQEPRGSELRVDVRA